MSSQDVQRPICIIGLGLIGGSLLRDLAGYNHDVFGYNHSTSAARTRIEARSGARKESVSPVKISSRPVLRLHPGGPKWVAQLRQTESLGGRIEIF